MRHRQFWLLAHFVLGYARERPARALIWMAAIATGVALGYCVHLINASALQEFSSAARSLAGIADLSVAGPVQGFDENWYARIAADPSVAMAAPLLEVDASVDIGAPHRAAPGGTDGASLRVIGIDALRSAWLEPDLIGAAPTSRAAHAPLERLLSDGLFVSPRALAQLGRSPGDEVTLIVGDRRIRLPIAGELPAAREAIAVMDLGYAQWRLGRLGLLTRIDVKFAPGANSAAVVRAWHLPPQLRAERPGAAAAREESLSRAYRINLDVLSMVALFTGAFLVFSMQAQAVAARRPQLALLRTLGATRGEVLRMLLGEALCFGSAGAAAGLLLAAALADAALRARGGDLGGGYFPGMRPDIWIDRRGAATYFALGVAAAVCGAWLPAREVASHPPAPALKAGTEPAPGSQRPHTWLVAACFALAAALLMVPPVRDVPWGAFASIGALLVATIALKPLAAPLIFSPLAAWINARTRGTGDAPGWLAATRLARLPRFAAVGAAGIVASFALMVAMATMVGSFRSSLESWLTRMLPADLYVRAAPAGSTASFSERDLQRLRSDPAVARAQFSRSLPMVLDPAHAPVVLLARSVDRAQPRNTLPLVGGGAVTAAAQTPVWVSEAVADTFGAHTGVPLTLPIAGGRVPVTVAGVWRDYARQGGSIVMDVNDYQRLTADRARTDAALWLKPGHSPNEVAQRLTRELDAPAARFSEPAQLRAFSLRLFDRSFRITYLLEWAAIVIGLTGLATTFSAQAIARTREFGMLRHLGVSRVQIMVLLAFEALLVTLLAAALGLGAGIGIAWILVAFVNPQSFHWTMDLRVPYGLLAALVAMLLAAAALTSTLAGRRSLSIEAVRAVKDDW